MTKSRSVRPFVLKRIGKVEYEGNCAHDVPVLGLFAEQTQIDLKYRLEEPHVGTLVETDLMLPDVDNKNFRRR
jgi:hypothetical protein